MQHFKNKLFGNLFRQFRKESIHLNGPATTIHPKTPKSKRRLPQTLLQKFARFGKRGTSPPSSQDSYREFLKKIETNAGKNKAKF